MLAKTMKRFCEFTERINRWVSWLLVVMLVVLVGIVSVSVFFRYVLNDSLIWSSEASQYLCIWIGFLAASVSVRRQMHMGLSILVDRLGSKRRRAFGIFSHAAVFVFLVFVSYLGFRLAARQMLQI
jgi:TRAP-type transport system small permease protein